MSDAESSKQQENEFVNVQANLGETYASADTSFDDVAVATNELDFRSAELTAADLSEMKAMIAELAEHIRNADRHNCEVMAAVRDDIRELGEVARRARADVPAPLAPALSRAEDALAELALLAGQLQPATHAAQPTVAQTETAEMPAGKLTSGAGSAVDFEGVSDVAGASDVARAAQLMDVDVAVNEAIDRTDGGAEPADLPAAGESGVVLNDADGRDDATEFQSGSQTPSGVAGDVLKTADHDGGFGNAPGFAVAASFEPEAGEAVFNSAPDFQGDFDAGRAEREANVADQGGDADRNDEPSFATVPSEVGLAAGAAHDADDAQEVRDAQFALNETQEDEAADTDPIGPDTQASDELGIVPNDAQIARIVSSLEASGRLADADIASDADFDGETDFAVETDFGDATDGDVEMPAQTVSLVDAGDDVKLEANERDWLDARLKQIEAQLQAGPSQAHLSVSLDALTARVGDLQNNFETVIAELSTDRDQQTLSAIEASLIDLAGQVARSQNDLARLDSIEKEVAALSERMSPELLSSLIAPRSDNEDAFGFAAMGDPAPVDFQALAQDVSARVAAQLSAEMAMRPNDGADHDQLREMIAELVDKQRDGDASTNAMLDTLQQAMIRVLDRMDAVEQAQLALVDRMQSMPPTLRDAARDGETEASDAAHDRSALEEAQRALPIAVGQSSMAARDYAAQPASGSRSGEPMLAFGGATEARSGDVADDAGTEPTLRAAPSQAGSAGDAGQAETETPAGSIQDDLLAKRRAFSEAARRAAARASERSHEAAAKAAAKAVGKDDDGERKPAGGRVSVLGAINPAGDGNGMAAEADTVAEPPKKKRSLFKFWASGIILAAVALGTSRLVLVLHERANEAPVTVVAGADSAKAVTSADTAEPGPDAHNGATAQAGEPSFSDATGDADATQTADAGSSEVPQRATLTPRDGGVLNDEDAEAPPAAIGPASLRTAAINGSASAQFEIGTRFAEGRGVAQDFAKAAAWYRKAAAAGFALAQYRIATLYERGMGVSADVRQAKMWYARAAVQGNVKAMHNLAVITAGTVAGPRDYKTAATWFRKAADFGLADSQYNLAILHQNGLGVDKDLSEAYRWFALAGKSGDKEAARIKTAIGASLSDEKRAAIDAQVAIWQPKRYERSVNDAGYAGQLWKSEGGKV